MLRVIFWVPRRVVFDNRRFETLPKRRLTGYPLAYEDGTDTVFRNFGEVDIHSPMKMEQCSETSVKWISTLQ